MKQTYQTTLVCSLLVATGMAASAGDIYTWIGGDGTWNDASQWAGPANQFPNSILDTAFINGNQIQITLDTNISLAQLSILTAPIFLHQINPSL